MAKTKIAGRLKKFKKCAASCALTGFSLAWRLRWALLVVRAFFPAGSKKLERSLTNSEAGS